MKIQLNPHLSGYLWGDGKCPLNRVAMAKKLHVNTILDSGQTGLTDLWLQILASDSPWIPSFRRSTLYLYIYNNYGWKCTAR